MRRFANLFIGLAALSLTGPGCNPGDFSALADDAWADSRDPDVTSTDKNVFMGYAPRNQVQEGENAAHALVFGTGAISAVRFDYSSSGGFGRSSVTQAIQDGTQNAASGLPTLFARSRDDGYTIAIIPRTNGNYYLVGDVGDALNGDTISEEPFNFFSGEEAPESTVDLQFQTAAMGGVVVAGVGATGDQPDGPFFIEAQRIPGSPGDNVRCEFSPANEVPMVPDFNISGGVGVLDGSDMDATAGRYIVATDIGLRLVRYPLDPLSEPCITFGVDSQGVLVDSELEVGNFVGADGKDVVGAELGSAVLIAVDYDAGSQMFASTFAVAAPNGVSDEWGSSLALGDFDDDGESELAVGDPAEGTVHLFDLDVTGGTSEVAKSIEPLDSRDRFGKSLAAIPFYDSKDLLVVGTDSDVITYFRLFTDEESDSDLDPR